MGRLGFLFDQTKCIGCNACQMACKDKNNLEPGVFFRRADTIEYVENGERRYAHYSGACNHCQDAACVKACRTGAMYDREDGTVGHDPERCGGCGACIRSCPYGAIGFRARLGKVGKCDSCIDLRKEGRNPACVDACVTHCLEFGDTDRETGWKGDHEKKFPFLVNPDLGSMENVMHLQQNKGSTIRKKGARSLETELSCLCMYQKFAQFFTGQHEAAVICQSFDDWEEYGQRERRLEYDHLFRGTDANRNIPLWASVCKGEHALLNQTTLEVIQFYHKWGYEPKWIEGNPPDYIGEQLWFLAYLTAAICHELQKEPVNENAGAELEAARNDFIRCYGLPSAKAMRNALDQQTKVKGYQKLAALLEQLMTEMMAGGMLEPINQGMKWLTGSRAEAISGSSRNRFPFGLEPCLRPILEHGKNPAIPDKEAQVIPTAGLNNCGGICVIRPTVQEGCMLQISSDCSSHSPQIRACVRGRGYRKTFLNPDRLRYPMKRIGKRGSGQFERISWEEAVSIIAEQWKRIRDTYGPGSRYVIYGWGVAGVMRPGLLAQRLLALDGGYLDYFNSYSAACINYTSPYIYGTNQCGNSPADLLNTKLLVLWGDNPAETVFGPEKNFYLSKLKDQGIRILVIDPRMSQTAVAYADEWIGIRPSTDSALADAMAYVIWSEGLQDQHFMDTYCIGFDEAHMPEGVPAGESYYTYLFGGKDGVPKTPEWAEKITGIDAEVIRRLAREYASTKPACILPGLGPQRHGNGEQTTKGICMLACLTGNVGIPGGGSGGAGGLREHQEMELFTNQVQNPYPGKIPVFLWTKAIRQGREMTPREDRIKGMERLDSNIKMILNLAGNTLINQHSDVNAAIRILEDDTKCEFIVCSDIFMTPSARYADILLPATSVFEGNNITPPWRGSNYLLRNNKVVEPLFESRFEWEWLKEVAEKLGLYEAFVDGRPDLEQWLEDNYNILRKKEPGLPSYSRFCRLGGWQYPDPVHYVAFEQEIKDPGHHPFATPSGKIEIFSKRLYDFDQREDIPAIPGYVPCPEGPEDPLRKRYPLQLIGWHTRRRCHSIHDNNEWMEEVEKPGVWIHPKDAGKRGIRQGDLVEVWNDRGRVRIPAIVTGRIMEGVAAISQGGWYTPDQSGTDIRGSINVLTSAAHPTPLAKGNPQHTNLVEIALVSQTGL